MSSHCKEALKAYSSTLTELADNGGLYDVDDIASDPAANYLVPEQPHTIGEVFDELQRRFGYDAMTFTNPAIRRPGIYFRGVATFSGSKMYLLLPEMMHLAVNRQGEDKDKTLAVALGLSQRGNES